MQQLPLTWFANVRLIRRKKSVERRAAFGYPRFDRLAEMDLWAAAFASRRITLLELRAPHLADPVDKPAIDPER